MGDVAIVITRWNYLLCIAIAGDYLLPAGPLLPGCRLLYYCSQTEVDGAGAFIDALGEHAVPCPRSFHFPFPSSRYLTPPTCCSPTPARYPTRTTAVLQRVLPGWV